MKIVFFGTPQFAATILNYLLEQKVEVAAVITRPDKPKGRSKEPQPSPVKECALSKNLPVYQPIKASAPEFAEFLKTFQADVFIVAAYAEILKENILQIPKWGCINVHASILPKYRGAAPIHRSILSGDKESGVTIMKMALELDAGEIYSIAKTPITDEMTTGELTERLADLGSKALWEVLQSLEVGKAKKIAQDSAQATYAKKVVPSEAEVDWNQPSDTVHNHIRGMTPKPGAWCWVDIKGEKKRLAIKKARKQNSLKGEPGAIISLDPHELIIACGQGAIQILELQPEGKKAMPAEAFLRGISLDNLKFKFDSV